MEKTHAILEVDSRLRDGGTIGEFGVIFTTPIDLNRNRQYFMRVENVRIPTSFYNMTSFNNVLKVIEDPAGTPDILNDIIVPPGNYNESELRTTLVALLNAESSANGNSNTYVIAFNDITGKFTITTNITDFQIQSITLGSTINRNLGLLDDVYTSVSMSLISVAHIALNSARYLRLNTGLGSNNHYSKNNLENVSLHIPITEGRSTIQFYDNHEGYKAKLESFHNIKQLRMRISDADNNTVDFNGVDWSCEIVIYEWRG